MKCKKRKKIKEAITPELLDRLIKVNNNMKKEEKKEDATWYAIEMVLAVIAFIIILVAPAALAMNNIFANSWAFIIYGIYLLIYVFVKAYDDYMEEHK